MSRKNKYYKGSICMGKYKIYLATPKSFRKIGEANTLKEAERKGRVYRRKNAKKTKYWGAVVVYKGNVIVKTI